MSLSTGGRPRLGLTPEEMKARAIRQASESKQRRRVLKAELAKAQTLCNGSDGLCIRPATHGKLCEYHAGRLSGTPCITCGKIAMPKKRLCGFCEEEAEEKAAAQRNERRKRNRADLKAKVKEAVKQVREERKEAA